MFKHLHRASLLACLVASNAWAGYYPMYASWDQPDGIGSAITLTYSYSNLLAGGIVDSSGQSLSAATLRSAFEQAFTDYAAILPIHFVEVADKGPLPETGEYDPNGLADIRIGVVPNISDANAYAYFPQNTETSGLAGDVIFNGQRFGYGWSPVLFYAVAQHELGHSLGMGHYIESESAGNPASANSDYSVPVFPLNSLTISALQNVYGAGAGSVTPLSATPVPEPGTWALLLAGLSTLLLSGRKKS
jgi:hypothetical protein